LHPHGTSHPAAEGDQDSPRTTSRARIAALGRRPWIWALAVAAVQVAVLVLVPDGAREVGSFLVALPTFGVVAVVVLGGPRRRNR
jgi:hypothetical protein